MKAKVLHYAADRDDKIVATYKEVTVIGKHVGWYVEDKDEKHEGRDNIAIVERVDGICFVAEFLSRNAAFDKEHLAAVEAEARNLRAAMQERIAQKQWIPLTYVAAYEALGWDARPLKEHRGLHAHDVLGSVGLAGEEVHRADVDVGHGRGEEQVYGLGVADLDPNGPNRLRGVALGGGRGALHDDQPRQQGRIKEGSFHRLLFFGYEQ